MKASVNKWTKNTAKQLGLTDDQMLNLSWAAQELLKQEQKRMESGKDGFLFQQDPIQDIEAESALLARCILYPQDTLPLCSVFTMDHFYEYRHKAIWGAIKALPTQSISLDAVASYLASNDTLTDIGGRDFLKGMVYCVENANAEVFIDKVSNAYVLRSIINEASLTVQEAYSTNLNEANGFKNKVIQRYGEIVDINSQMQTFVDSKGLAEASREHYQMLKEAKKRGQAILGLHSFSPHLTNLLGGYQDEKLIIIAGRPGMGKTAHALSEAWAFGKQGKTGVFFSLEMGVNELNSRFFGIDTGRQIKEYKKALVSGGDMADHFWNLEHSGVIVEDVSVLHIDTLLDKCRVLNKKHGLDYVIVDYLQLMKGYSGVNYGNNRNGEVSDISRGLKMLAKELKIPVIALSQLNRSVETRGGSKRPQLSDLRESGAIEQDADVVIFDYRPEYYNIIEDDQGNSLVGVAKAIVAKHRGGPLSEVDCFFNAPCTRWEPIENKPAGYINESIEHQKEVSSQGLGLSIDDFKNFGEDDFFEV